MGIIPRRRKPWNFNPFGCATLMRLAEQQARRRCTIGDAEPAHALFDVAVHRLGRDLQLAADFLGGPMSGRQVEALALT